jgi:hypothetical protein
VIDRVVTFAMLAVVACARPPEPKRAAEPAPVTVVIGTPAASAPDLACVRRTSIPPNEWLGSTDVLPRIGKDVPPNAKTANVTVIANTALMRKHPPLDQLGAFLRDGYLLVAQGSERQFDPVQSLDWAVLYGPSLFPYDHNVALLQPNESAEVVSEALSQMTSAAGKQRELIAGIDGALYAGQLGRTEKLFFHTRANQVLAIPPYLRAPFAEHVGRAGAQLAVNLRPNEVFREVIRQPASQNMPIPSSVTELRIWVVPQVDCGVDIHFEIDCPTEQEAQRAANEITAYIRSRNTGAVEYATGGLLDGARVQAEGKGAKLRLIASHEQLQRMIGLARMAMEAEAPRDRKD